MEIKFYRHIGGRLTWYRSRKTEEDRITSRLEILTDADAFVFNSNLFFVGGKFIPLDELEKESGLRIDLRSKWVYGVVITRSGPESFVHHCRGQYHLKLDNDGKLIVPEEYQEREIIRRAHNHVIYGQLNANQALDILANCKHVWSDDDQDISGADVWECKKCGLGYAIDPSSTRQENDIHQRILKNWPNEVGQIGELLPALIYSGIKDLPLGRAQIMGVAPIIPGYTNI